MQATYTITCDEADLFEGLMRLPRSARLVEARAEDGRNITEEACDSAAEQLAMEGEVSDYDDLNPAIKEQVSVELIGALWPHEIFASAADAARELEREAL